MLPDRTRQRRARRVFAVDEKDLARLLGNSGEPFEKLCGIRMGRQRGNLFDLRGDMDGLAQDLNVFGAFENGPDERALRLIADEEQYGIGIGQTPDEMMQYTAAVEHARRGYNDRGSAKMIQALRFVGRARELDRRAFE